MGDSALLVGDTGIVVSPQDPAALSTAWGDLVTMSPDRRSLLGNAARQRVAEHFSLPAIAERYAALYRELSDGVRDRRIS